MIQARVEFQGEVITAVENLAHDFNVISFALFRQTYNKVGKQMLYALRFTPPRRYWKGDDFVSDASRRAFFAKTGGKAYQRTGRYAKAWQVILRQTPNGGEIVARNDVAYAKFVGGSFNRSRDFQQPGHKRTGWPNAAATVDYWQEQAIEDFETRLDKTLDERLGRVAFSTRNR